MVSPVTFRHASVLAKNAVTVDHVSGGRVELGIGAGWYEAEHESYGFPFGAQRARLDELDRQLAEIVRQWTEADDVRPLPVQRPRPPIIVGGRAKPRTVARGGPLRRRVQHDVPVGRGGARAGGRAERGGAGRGARRRCGSR